MKRFEFAQLHMGTLFRLILYAPTVQEATRAASRAFHKIEELEQVLSHYRHDSELNRLCRVAHQSPQVVSPDLFRVLQESHRVSRLSDGAFDITVGPLVELWQARARQGKLPSPAQLARARKQLGYRNISYNPIIRSVRLAVPGLSIDLGAIGKGYAADAALEVLQRQGLRSVLIDAGGDLRLGDPPPGTRGWAVAVEPGPEAGSSTRLWLANCGIATSSDDFQFFEIHNKRYSHIIDPATGLGVEHGGLVTVVAPRAATADALATALSVMGPAAGIRLLEALDGVEGRFLERTKSASPVVHQTADFATRTGTAP